MSTSSLTPVTNSNYIAGGSYSSRDLSQIIPKIEYIYATCPNEFNNNPVLQTINISGNGTTNYSVVVSEYYNYPDPGSGGTYKVSEQTDNFGTIVIYNKQNTSFTFTVNRTGTGDYTNLDLVFAVIYGIS